MGGTLEAEERGHGFARMSPKSVSLVNSVSLDDFPQGIASMRSMTAQEMHDMGDSHSLHVTCAAIRRVILLCFIK